MGVAVGEGLPEHTRGCEILKVDAAGAWACGNLQVVPFLFSTNQQKAKHPSHCWVTFTQTFRATSFEVLSECANRHRSDGGFDLDTTGSRPKLAWWWACSSDKIKKPGFICLLELNALKTHTYTLRQIEVEQAADQKLGKAVSVWERLFLTKSFFLFFSSLRFSRAESALLWFVISCFKAFEWKIFFFRQIQHPK